MLKRVTPTDKVVRKEEVIVVEERDVLSVGDVDTYVPRRGCAGMLGRFDESDPQLLAPAGDDR